jgi:hypothetical protein
MKIKSLALIGAMAICLMPVVATANTGANDITIANNSNHTATAYAGKKGIIQPHSQITVPGFAIGMYCTNDCEAKVFMDDHCKGKSISTVTLNLKEGIKRVVDTDNSETPYHVVGAGRMVSIEGGPQRKWYQLFS